MARSYCGIIINRLLEEPVTGKWEPLVSREDFVKVQQILENNPSGFQHNKDEEARPLTRLLKCHDCGCYMVGYKNNQKNLHYYRCLKCNGVSVNAFTTVRAQRKGANDLFVDFLQKYAIPEKIAPLVKLQLTKIFNHYNDGNSTNEATLKSQMDVLERKMKELKVRYGLGDIDKETFDLTASHLNKQISETAQELNTLAPKISNLEKLISSGLEKLSKLALVWSSSNLEMRRRIQKTLFPDGISYDVKNHQYLTKRTNSFLYVTDYLTRQFEGEGIKKSR